jgi:invasion protein IalB
VGPNQPARPAVQGEVKGDMRRSIFPSMTLGHVRAAGALTGALMLGITVLLAPAGAQAPPPAKKDKAPAPPAAAPAQKAPAAAAPGKAAAVSPPPGTPQSAWVKLCEKATATQKTKDGKDEKKELNICLTHHERLDGNSGMVLVSAAVRQVEGQDKQAFMVMVPLGMMLQPGMRATLYPKDLWEKAQKNEKIDETKLKPISLAYTLCHPAGCTAETEATADLLNELKKGGGLMVFAINATGAPAAFPVPLIGFEQSYSGPPVDSQKYSEARRTLMQQIAQRQHEMMEEYKKQQAAKEGGATGSVPAAPAAPPAKK